MKDFKVAANMCSGNGGGVVEVSGMGREEGIGEIDISILRLDGLVKVYDGKWVNREGAVASVNDVIKDGFNAVGVKHLITRGRGVDGKTNDNETTSDLGVCPDTTLREAEVLGM